MNSWAFVTIMLSMSLLTGYVISFNYTENTYHDYLYEKLKGYDKLQSSMKDSLYETSHTAGEYKVDDTVGDSQQITNDWVKALDYGFNPLVSIEGSNKYESSILSIFQIYKTLVFCYTVLFLFMVWKNKKNT